MNWLTNHLIYQNVYETQQISFLVFVLFLLGYLKVERIFPAILISYNITLPITSEFYNQNVKKQNSFLGGLFKKEWRHCSQRRYYLENFIQFSVFTCFFQRPSWCIEQWRNKSFRNLIKLLCKTWARFCHCFVHQHGHLIKSVKTKNSVLFEDENHFFHHC